MTSAYTPSQVAEMLQEKVEAINRHCRNQALKGAYKKGRGKTAPGGSRRRPSLITSAPDPGSMCGGGFVPPTVYPPETIEKDRKCSACELLSKRLLSRNLGAN